MAYIRQIYILQQTSCLCQGLPFNPRHALLSNSIIKGTLPQNIFILKNGYIGGWEFFSLKISRNCNFRNLLVPETMRPHHVRSKVCHSAWLPSMCRAMHTLLHTGKGAMQTSLCTWSGDIGSGTKKLSILPNLLRNFFKPIIFMKFL